MAILKLLVEVLLTNNFNASHSRLGRNAVEIGAGHTQDFSKRFPLECGYISTHFKEPEMV